MDTLHSWIDPDEVRDLLESLAKSEEKDDGSTLADLAEDDSLVELLAPVLSDPLSGVVLEGDGEDTGDAVPDPVDQVGDGESGTDEGAGPARCASPEVTRGLDERLAKIFHDAKASGVLLEGSREHTEAEVKEPATPQEDPAPPIPSGDPKAATLPTGNEAVSPGSVPEPEPDTGVGTEVIGVGQVLPEMGGTSSFDDHSAPPTAGFSAPERPLPARFESLGDWIAEVFGARRYFVADEKGFVVHSRGVGADLISSSTLLSEAGKRARTHLPEMGQAIHLDMGTHGLVCLIPTPVGSSELTLGVVVDRRLESADVSLLSAALSSAVGGA